MKTGKMNIAPFTKLHKNPTARQQQSVVQAGFTVVELVVLIFIVGLLVTLVITTHSGIQSQDRNTTRKSDLKRIAPQLEAFYSDQAYYPSEADLSSPTWDTKNLSKLPLSDLHDPIAPGSSITLSMTLGKPGSYQYVAKDVTGSIANCEAKDTTCSSFTLTAPLEGGGTYVKTNDD